MIRKFFLFFRRKRAIRTPIYLTSGGITITGTNLMARMTDQQTISISIQPMTESGNPARVDGDATFSDTTGLGSFRQISSTEAVYTPNGVGVTQIVVTADADLDAGETRTLTASGALEVIRAEEEATTMEIVFGEPEAR